MNTFKNHFFRICREIAKPNLKEFNRLKILSKCSSLVIALKYVKMYKYEKLAKKDKKCTNFYKNKYFRRNIFYSYFWRKQTIRFRFSIL